MEVPFLYVNKDVIFCYDPGDNTGSLNVEGFIFSYNNGNITLIDPTQRSSEKYFDIKNMEDILEKLEVFEKEEDLFTKGSPKTKEIFMEFHMYISRRKYILIEFLALYVPKLVSDYGLTNDQAKKLLYVLEKYEIPLEDIHDMLSELIGNRADRDSIIALAMDNYKQDIVEIVYSFLDSEETLKQILVRYDEREGYYFVGI